MQVSGSAICELLDGWSRNKCENKMFKIYYSNIKIVVIIIIIDK